MLSSYIHHMGFWSMLRGRLLSMLSSYIHHMGGLSMLRGEVDSTSLAAWETTKDSLVLQSSTPDTGDDS